MSDVLPLTAEGVAAQPLSAVPALLQVLQTPQQTEYILIDQLDCCRVGRVSVATWYRLVRQGVMPKPIKIGRASRWNLRQVIAAFQQLENPQK